ncbi:TPA: hypothetical protein DCW38_02820 [candidate division WOR-3 bacterium]|jgi:Tfp pilus assembly protein PilE|uniref:Uncharacterized protein n=1 Tax=candidate division WOR-3 bacterium TaxID=2052148 RepID=A0A350H979_UNCW3|nr:hypothetical protein [candidate division WOR-3 bacterium]
MKKFPLIEIGIVVATAILLYILIYPGYVQNKEMNHKYDVISNIYAVKTAYEMFVTLDNNGVLTENVNPKVTEYLNSFGVKNPYSGEAYTPSDITIYSLDNPIDVADNTLSGKHGIQRGKPGTFSVGIYIPDLSTYKALSEKKDKTKDDKKALEKMVLEVRKYTVIGFGEDSMPVSMKDMSEEKEEVFYLTGEKTAVEQ